MQGGSNRAHRAQLVLHDHGHAGIAALDTFLSAFYRQEGKAMTAIDLHFPAFMRAAILYVIAPVNFSQRPSLFERWKRTVLNAHAAKLDKKVLDFKHEGALEIPRREVPKDVLMRIANCPITLSPRFPRAMELDATQSVSDDVSFKYLRAWIQQGGGWISDKLYLGLSRNYRGIYCNESIRQGELLFKVPNHLHISKKTSHKLAIGQHIRNLPDMYFLTYALMYELAHPDSFWKIPLQFVSFDLPKLTLFDSTQTMLNTYHEFGLF
jgi:hypothetical protein